MKRALALAAVPVTITVGIALWAGLPGESRTRKPNDPAERGVLTSSHRSLPSGDPAGRSVRAYYSHYYQCIARHSAQYISRRLATVCPLAKWQGLSRTFLRARDAHYLDRVLCDEGIPLTVSAGHASYMTPTSAQVYVDTRTRDGSEYSIPVYVRATRRGWRITDILCDEDGHID